MTIFLLAYLTIAVFVVAWLLYASFTAPELPWHD
jgi:hypothetical protein